MIGARQESRAGGRAQRRSVVVREDLSVGGQGVEVRSPDLPAERAQVGIAEIVRKDHQDVGPTLGTAVALVVTALRQALLGIDVHVCRSRAAGQGRQREPRHSAE
jgi:hypothetical protein